MSPEQSRVSLQAEGRGGWRQTEEQARPGWSRRDVTMPALKTGGTGMRPQPRTAQPQELEEAGRSLPYSLQKGHGPAPTLSPAQGAWLQISGLQRSVVLIHPICGHFLSSHWKLRKFLKIKTPPAVANRGWEWTGGDRRGLLDLVLHLYCSGGDTVTH